MPGPYDDQFAAIRQKIAYYASKYGVPVELAIKQIWAESKFNPRASSDKANGIAQFTPGTANRFRVNVWDVDSSLDGYGRYMRWLLNRYRGDQVKAVAGYNAGEGNVDKYGGVPPFRETVDYIKKIFGGGGATGYTPPAASVGDVLGVSSLKSWLFEEKVATAEERFSPYLKTQRTINPQARMAIATGIIVIVIAFAWREF